MHEIGEDVIARGVQPPDGGEFDQTPPLTASGEDRDDLDRLTIIEGMIAAQLLAAHNAAMECYRRAMIGEQSFEGRRENLSQANKLSRTYAALIEALNRHRGKGQHKVTVEHVHVHTGGQAIVGSVSQSGGGRDNDENRG